MKSIIQNLLMAAGIICLTSSFVPGTHFSNQVPGEYATMVAVPFGGAHVFFAGKYGGEIRKSELVNQKEVAVEGCAKGSKIFKFSLAITKGGTKTTLQANSNVLTKEMLDKLNSLSRGDSFEFVDVKAYGTNGKDVIDVYGQKYVVV